jgi:hypothetical protein
MRGEIIKADFDSKILTIKMYRVPMRIKVYEGQEVDIHFKKGMR